MDVLYRERLAPPLTWWLLAVALAGTSGWVVWVAAGPELALATAVVVLALLGAALLAMGRTVLRVETGPDGRVLVAGPARLELEVVTRAAALDAAQARGLRGTGFDPLAFHVSRGWRQRGVRLDIADPRDPTPYWYLSSARPELVVAAVARARAAG